MRRAALVVVLSALAVLGSAWGQTYPSHPVRVLNGFQAGGPPDIMLRQIATRLEPRLGQPVVVENRAGASGTIAASAVAKGAADGYTLLFAVAANMAAAPATMGTPPYDPASDFTAIIEVARAPYVWLVPADAPAQDLRQFVAWAKANPGKLNYATPGQGTVHHLATEMFERNAGIELVHVPYTSGLYPAMLAGQVQGMFESMPGPLPYLRSGKLRALAVTGIRRLPILPDVPTLEESGVKGVEANSWWGFVGPKGLPAPIVQRLNADIAATLRDREVLEVYSKMGIEPSPGSAADFSRYIGDEYARWKQVAAAAGVKL
jgi:tripartite-type tricarboxylate transporter receptor subunit TctC